MTDLFSPFLGEGTLIFKGLAFSTFLWGLLGAGALVALAFALQLGKAPRLVKPFTFFLRLSAAALVLALLTEPILRNEEAIPQQSFLLHLYDTSASMDIGDYERQPRMSAVFRETKTSAARTELDRLFRKLDFTFDDDLNLLGETDLLKATDGPTDLLTALRGLQAQIKGLPISGVVLASDGNATLNADRQASSRRPGGSTSRSTRWAPRP